ncbi:hypothetical protein [Variovorax sp. UC122_21]|uniref:hypothetical protein n=1 Tax=Variovorax sp. UC122_21 TaxID=3374554 RepID=UPI003757431D
MQRRQRMVRERLFVAARLVEAARDAFAQVQQLALAPAVPVERARMALLREALARFLAAFARPRHALLAHRLERGLAVLDAAQLVAQIAQRGLQLALAADQLRLDRGLRCVARPEAQALHLLEHDLLLGARADARVELLARECRIGDGGGRGWGHGRCAPHGPMHWKKKMRTGRESRRRA